mmetsp:Transcript_13105/g.24164  ORF Transcript_13105/g.24164 Transcript_13105/m.24164 type:complete len:969 (+) Transcript_13105:174-3080(+)
MFKAKAGKTRKDVKKAWLGIKMIINMGDCTQSEMKQLQKTEKEFYDTLLRPTTEQDKNEEEIERRRKSNESSEDMQEILSLFWFVVSQDRDVATNELTKEGYILFNRRVQRALVGSDIDEEDSIKFAEADYESDVAMYGPMVQDAFYDVMYELLDSWAGVAGQFFRSAFAWALFDCTVNHSMYPPRFKRVEYIKLMTETPEKELLKKYSQGIRTRIKLKKWIKFVKNKRFLPETFHRLTSRKDAVQLPRSMADTLAIVGAQGMALAKLQSCNNTDPNLHDIYNPKDDTKISLKKTVQSIMMFMPSKKKKKARALAAEQATSFQEKVDTPPSVTPEVAQSAPLPPTSKFPVQKVQHNMFKNSKGKDVLALTVAANLLYEGETARRQSFLANRSISSVSGFLHNIRPLLESTKEEKSADSADSNFDTVEPFMRSSDFDDFDPPSGPSSPGKDHGRRSRSPPSPSTRKQVKQNSVISPVSSQGVSFMRVDVGRVESFSPPLESGPRSGPMSEPKPERKSRQPPEAAGSRSVPRPGAGADRPARTAKVHPEAHSRTHGGSKARPGHVARTVTSHEKLDLPLLCTYDDVLMDDACNFEDSLEDLPYGSSRSGSSTRRSDVVHVKDLHFVKPTKPSLRRRAPPIRGDSRDEWKYHLSDDLSMDSADDSSYYSTMSASGLMVTLKPKSIQGIAAKFPRSRSSSPLLEVDEGCPLEQEDTLMDFFEKYESENGIEKKPNADEISMFSASSLSTSSTYSFMKRLQAPKSPPPASALEKKYAMQEHMKKVADHMTESLGINPVPLIQRPVAQLYNKDGTARRSMSPDYRGNTSPGSSVSSGTITLFSDNKKDESLALPVVRKSKRSKLTGQSAALLKANQPAINDSDVETIGDDDVFLNNDARSAFKSSLLDGAEEDDLASLDQSSSSALTGMSWIKGARQNYLNETGHIKANTLRAMSKSIRLGNFVVDEPLDLKEY